MQVKVLIDQRDDQRDDQRCVPRRALSSAVILGALALSLACGESEPDDLTTGPVIGPVVGGGSAAGDTAGEPTGGVAGSVAGEPAGDTAGEMPPLPAGSPAGSTGGAEMVLDCTEVGPNLDVLASEVGPMLVLNCTNCHRPMGFPPPNFPVDTANLEIPIEEPLLTETLNAMLEYIEPGKPDQSSLFEKAIVAHSGSTALEPADADAFEAWIDGFVSCVEVAVEPMGGEPVGGEPMGGDPLGGEPVAGMPVGPGSTFCDLLPNGDPQNRADGQYYALFESDVSDSLQLSCASRTGCHATPDYGFWLQPSSDPCSVPANFLMIQAYINFVNADDSPVLKAPYDPAHSGYMIYTGRSDPRFVELRNWILLAFE